MHLALLIPALAALLQAAEPTKVTRVLQRDFEDADWAVAVEEPRFDDEKYAFLRCNETKNVRLSCVASIAYRLYDDVWYEGEPCELTLPLSRHSVNEALRLTSLSNDRTIVSFSVYSQFEPDRAKHTELNRIDWLSCAVWENNTLMEVGENVYDVIPYADSFDFVNKANQSFDNLTEFRIRMSDANDEIGRAVIQYPYEKPEAYRSFDVYPVSDRGSAPSDYFFVYDFVHSLKVFVADASGKIRRGKKLFQKYLSRDEDYRFRDVHHSARDGRILVCGHVWYDVTYVSQCTLLDDGLSVEWELEYATREAERYLDVKLLKSGDVLLVADYPELKSDTIRIFRVDKITKSREILHEFDKSSDHCDGATPEFGRVYEVKDRSCFSTYCKRDDEVVKRWSATCFSGAATFLASTVLLIVVAGCHAFNYLSN